MCEGVKEEPVHELKVVGRPVCHIFRRLCCEICKVKTGRLFLGIEVADYLPELCHSCHGSNGILGGSSKLGLYGGWGWGGKVFLLASSPVYRDAPIQCEKRP